MEICQEFKIDIKAKCNTGTSDKTGAGRVWQKIVDPVDC